MFSLHPQLEKDSILLGKLSLCQVRLLADSDHPWVLLVPVKENIKEIHELTEDEQVTLIKEISKVSKAFEVLFNPDKINVGALGNMVPQLHVHIICRFQGDRSWPGAIWGTERSQDEEKIKSQIELLKNTLF